MPFYQLTELDRTSEHDSYYFYQGKDEIQIQLNFGFSIAKEIVEFIAHHSQASEPLSLYIVYQKEKLTYMLGTADSELREKLNKHFSSCVWEKLPRDLDTAFAAEKVTLSGSVSPLVLQDRKENLLDELVKMIPREDFLIQVKFHLKQESVFKEQLRLLHDHIAKLSQKSMTQVGEQGHLGENLMKMIAGGENTSYQLKDVTAQQQLEVLENHLYVLSTQGTVFKQVDYHIYAGDGIASLIAKKMESFARRSGSLSMYQLRKQASSSLEYVNYAAANCIAPIIALPTSGVPGIKLNRRVEFDVDLQEPQYPAIELGTLVKHHATRIPVQIALKDLTKHVFVSGVTGSGKTSTIKSLLMKAVEAKKPFLVLEPAKTEYKYLENQVPNLRRYTLGIEGANGFRINPFAFPEHIHIQTHLDHLKSVFVAAFPMYGPMPYILETTFYHIYQRTGWDFISGTNLFAEQLERQALFPTMEDLHQAIDQAIEAVGYSADLTSDIRGALKVRIGSLLSGAKGSILNTQEGHSIPELLQTPTVMELEYIGDDQEKVFLMGLLLVSIYEHYSSEGKHSGTLQHLLVIEEAHRLLENAQRSSNQEIGDLRGKAVETFNHMLSEIRTYGQGMIIADQIPTKLSPDIIKNTNLKIIHRLFAKDDRQLVGESIGLDDEQIQEIIRLKQGEAVIFHGQIDRPMKVHVQVDAELLAENQADPKRPERAPFDLARFVLQQERFRSDSKRLIGTYLLFPEAECAINEKLSQLVSRITGQQFDQGTIQGLWSSLVQRFLQDTSLAEWISYVYLVEIKTTIQQGEAPLEVLRDALTRFLPAASVPYSMERYADLATPYAWMKTLFPTGEALSVLLEHPEELHQDNRRLQARVLKYSGIAAMVELSVLNSRHKSRLCHAIVLDECGDYPELLEKYFAIKPLQPWVTLGQHV